MHSKKHYLLIAVVCAVAIFSTNARPAFAFQTSSSASSATDIAQDEPTSNVRARVGRISFISGQAQVKRLDSGEWERVVLNLPLVEGDEISTESGARLEIQFDSDSYARLAEGSYLKITTLRDEGIAVSLSQGRGSFRLLRFDLARAYLEIDAPGTTIAPQHAGMYDVTAVSGGSEVRVTVTESGEARIYSESSGFLLKDGRTALMHVGGSNAGEFELGRAETFVDEFTSWSLNRDAAISKALQNAAYDKYYDRDIYGAEDLNDNGEWIHTKKHGYVWRPYAAATSSYTAWSPYRYGQWRWVPPYGWTWVNDEPWGWATYHHGRWFFDEGYWYWSPYGAYRNVRSWWSPALVYVTIFGGNVCWYPLPYSYAYYNYNYYYHHHVRGPRGAGHNGGTGGPTPTPTPVPPITGGGTLMTSRNPRPPVGIVPPTAVVAVPVNQFGMMIKGDLRPPLSVANTVLSTNPDVVQTSAVLPTVSDVRQRGGRDILTSKPPSAFAETARTGASVRRPGAPLDQDLRTTRIFGGRNQVNTVVPSTNTVPGDRTSRPTGAVDRPTPVLPKPTSRPPVISTPTGDQPPRYVPPVRQDPPTSRTPAPRYEPPARQDPPTSRPPTPRNDPPPRQDPPASRQPPPKSDPPAAKPGPDVKPPIDTNRKRDGV